MLSTRSMEFSEYPATGVRLDNWSTMVLGRSTVQGDLDPAETPPAGSRISDYLRIDIYIYIKC